MTTKREYPFTAWTLQPSFKPVQVELIRDTWYKGTHCTSKGAYKHDDDLFHTKREAIEEGHVRLAAQEADLAKRAEKIAKKRAALDKAEREA